MLCVFLPLLVVVATGFTVLVGEAGYATFATITWLAEVLSIRRGDFSILIGSGLSVGDLSAMTGRFYDI